MYVIESMDLIGKEVSYKGTCRWYAVSLYKAYAQLPSVYPCSQSGGIGDFLSLVCSEGMPFCNSNNVNTSGLLTKTKKKIHCKQLISSSNRDRGTYWRLLWQFWEMILA